MSILFSAGISLLHSSSTGKRIARNPTWNARSVYWFNNDANRKRASVCIGTDSGWIERPVWHE